MSEPTPQTLLAGMLTEAEAAAQIGKSHSTLRRLRYDGTGPRYLLVGGRIRYRMEDLREWLDACLVDPAAKAQERRRKFGAVGRLDLQPGRTTAPGGRP